MTFAKAGIKAKAGGRVFDSLDEALAWVKRQLEDLGILRGADNANAAPTYVNGQIDGFSHNRSLSADNILDPKFSKAPNPGTSRHRAVMRKLKGIRNVRGNRTLSGTINPAEADLLGFEFLGPGFRGPTTAKNGIVYYTSADGLRKYRPPSAKNSPYAKTGFQANYETRPVPSGPFDNAHIDIDPFR